MNTIKCIVAVAVCFWACIGQTRAAAFVNLDFEEAANTLPPSATNSSPPVTVSAAQAFSGWQAYIGSSLQPVVQYNNYLLVSPGLSLLGPGQGFNHPIEGNFVALLQSGFSGGNFLSASLAQTGDIPAGAMSLQIKMYLPANDTFQVTLGGTPIAMFPTMTTPQYTLFSGDIRDQAGQTMELRVTALAPAIPLGNSVYFDTIRFSAVPEPSTVALVLTGLVVAGVVRRLSRKP